MNIIIIDLDLEATNGGGRNYLCFDLTNKWKWNILLVQGYIKMLGIMQCLFNKEFLQVSKAFTPI